MRAFRAPTMTALHGQLCETLTRAREDQIDLITGVDIQIHNVMAEAKTMEWEFDLKNAWLTKSRWSMMVRQYIDPEALEEWIGLCTSKLGVSGRGIAVMRTKTVKPRGGVTNQLTRRWGSCMISISYRALPKPQIVLHSRTSYLGYLGALDMTVAWMCGKYLARELGLEMKDLSFIWFNENMQWHNFKSLAYLLSNSDPKLREEYRRLMTTQADELSSEDKQLILKSPGLWMSRKWLRKVLQDDERGRHYGEVFYNTFLRVVRRYHTEVLGYEVAKSFEGWKLYRKGPKAGERDVFNKAYLPLPSVPVSTLDFSPIGMPLTRKYGDPFIGGFDDTDDEDD